MGKIQIMTDSASDISYADEQRYSISVIPFPITLGDKSYQAGWILIMSSSST